MELTILTDNNTIIDRYYLGEPGFSAYIREENLKILFDLGYSGVFLQNAWKMGIFLEDLDYICVSHGHADHTWGFDPLIRHYTEREQEKRPVSRPVILAHPDAFHSISGGGVSELGALIPGEKLDRLFTLALSPEPRWLTPRLVFLGEIPRSHSFEGNTALGERNGEADYVKDDTALAYRGTEGLVIITGCSHSGIGNIIEYAKKITGEERILDVIGGFHLLNPGQDQLEGTCRYFAGQKVRQIHPCHCTDLASKIALSRVVRVEETGVSQKLEYR